MGSIAAKRLRPLRYKVRLNFSKVLAVGCDSLIEVGFWYGRSPFSSALQRLLDCLGRFPSTVVALVWESCFDKFRRWRELACAFALALLPAWFASPEHGFSDFYLHP